MIQRLMCLSCLILSCSHLPWILKLTNCNFISLIFCFTSHDKLQITESADTESTDGGEKEHLYVCVYITQTTSDKITPEKLLCTMNVPFPF